MDVKATIPHEIRAYKIPTDLIMTFGSAYIVNDFLSDFRNLLQSIQMLIGKDNRLCEISYQNHTKDIDIFVKV